MIKQMTVSYKATRYFSDAIPMLRLANRQIKSICNINIGDRVTVEYGKNILIVRKKMRT